MSEPIPIPSLPIEGAGCNRRTWEPPTREALLARLRGVVAGLERMTRADLPGLPELDLPLPSVEERVQAVAREARRLLGWESVLDWSRGPADGPARLLGLVAKLQEAVATGPVGCSSVLRPQMLADALREAHSACLRTPELLRGMDWGAFEALVAESFYRHGFQLLHGAVDAAGERDLLALRRPWHEGGLEFLACVERREGAARVAAVDRVQLTSHEAFPWEVWLCPLEGARFGMPCPEPVAWWPRPEARQLAAWLLPGEGPRYEPPEVSVAALRSARSMARRNVCA